jgi:hypothetical protein
LLLGHDLLPHHHSVHSDAVVTLNPEDHHDDDHIHFFTGIHATHPASSTTEIIHYQYQKSRPVSLVSIIPFALPVKPEISPPEIVLKTFGINHHSFLKRWGITRACGLRAPPAA